MNTVMGLGTVFVILVFLIFVISLFKYIPGLVEGKKKESAPAPAAAAPAPVVAAPVAEPAVEDVTDDAQTDLWYVPSAKSTAEKDNHYLGGF